MRSTSKIRINLSILFISTVFSHGIQAAANIPPLESNAAEISDTIYDGKKIALNIKYLPKKRIIFIESPNRNIFYKLATIEKNSNPELVGAEGDIKFFSKYFMKINGRKFVAASYSERSTHGDGSGQCGAGVERYFVSLELEKNTLTQRNKFLIESCKKGIVLAEESKEMKSVFLEGGNSIVFNWINYPGYEGPVTGRFFFKENKLSLENRGWGGFTEQNSERQ